MHYERFRVPDKVFWILVVLIILFTAVAVSVVYHDLPSRLPVHFDVRGQTNVWVTKSIWSAYWPVIGQLALSVLLAWVYRHPEYSNLPTSMALALLPEHWREKIVWLLKHMLVMVAVIINLMLAYIAMAIITASQDQSLGINGWAIGGLVVLLILLVGVYTVWLYRWTKEAIAEVRGQQADA